MPHRTPKWVWTGRVVAVAAVIGLAGYLVEMGLSRGAEVAGVVTAVITLAALLAPYVLPPSAPPHGGDVFIGDRGGIAARHIHEVNVNPPPPDSRGAGGQADR
jgi:hypothetical protein